MSFLHSRQAPCRLSPSKRVKIQSWLVASVRHQKEFRDRSGKVEMRGVKGMISMGLNEPLLSKAFALEEGSKIVFDE